MIATLALAAVLFQEPGAPAQAAPAADTTFSAAPSVLEPRRLQITPILDGVVQPEEWDPFASAGGVNSYLQWEPSKLHVAATLAAGQDLVISIDEKGDGWLVGRDNVEVRIGMRDGQATVRSRVLDATRPEGPAWDDRSGFEVSTSAVAKVTGETMTVEATLQDPGTGFLEGEDDRKFAMRVDAVPATQDQYPPFLPRVCAPVELVRHRSIAAPNEMRFRPELTGRKVMPGDPTRIRLTFTGSDALGLQRLSLRSEGLARAATNELVVPFPPFDNKGRAFVDFDTRVTADASLGYRVLLGQLTFKDGPAAVLQTSYEIAPLLRFDLVRQRVQARPGSQVLKMVVFLKSNSTLRVRGEMTVVPPPRFEVLKGNAEEFTIANSRGRIRRVFDLLVPPSAQGTFPITFQGKVGDRTVEQVAYLRIP